jgi:hypothetical protein
MVKTDKQRLDEVRLTLQRLQRIAIEPTDAAQSGKSVASVPDKASKIHQMWPLAGAFKAPPMAALFQRRWIGAISVCVVGITLWWLVAPGSYRADTPATATGIAIGTSVRTPPQEPAEMAKRAQKLIDSGKVVIAREQLAELAMHSPEAALVLARSYDPNFLRLIPKPDASADPKEAERWYRVWRDIAAERGMVMETERLERIIKAMR